MNVEITPAIEEAQRAALLAALERAAVRADEDDPYRRPWRTAGLREAAEGDEADVRYAFSPRSTRGATRA